MWVVTYENNSVLKMYIGTGNSADTFLEFSMKLIGDATPLYRRHKSTDLVRLVRDDLAANNLHTKTVA